MLQTNQKQPKIGDCEACDAVNVKLIFMHNSMWICESCRDKEILANTQAQQRLTNMIEESRRIDSSVKVSSDIMVVKTIPIVEVLAAIEQNESIPQDKKNDAFVEECRTKVLHLKQVLFERRQAVQETESELRAWQVNGQQAAGKLRSDLRAQYKEFDITYEPTPITKKQKTTKPVKSGKTFDKKALYAASAKYGVDAMVVRSLMISHKGWSEEQAAKYLHGMINPS